jgi:cellulose synthase/poly-beta-1,6-N-acetylglucosamine synthase-like glycosyltransferase
LGEDEVVNRLERILVIIPAYNEEDSGERLIEDVRTNCPQMDILVVNDGPTDRTSDKASVKRVVVLGLPFNLGIGEGYKPVTNMPTRRVMIPPFKRMGMVNMARKEIPKLLHTSSCFIFR